MAFFCMLVVFRLWKSFSAFFHLPNGKVREFNWVWHHRSLVLKMQLQKRSENERLLINSPGKKKNLVLNCRCHCHPRYSSQIRQNEKTKKSQATHFYPFYASHHRLAPLEKAELASLEVIWVILQTRILSERLRDSILHFTLLQGLIWKFGTEQYIKEVK